MDANLINRILRPDLPTLSEQDRDRKGSISLLRYNFQHENQQQISRSALKNYLPSVRNQNDGALTCILEVYIP